MPNNADALEKMAERLAETAVTARLVKQTSFSRATADWRQGALPPLGAAESSNQGAFTDRPVAGSLERIGPEPGSSQLAAKVLGRLALVGVPLGLAAYYLTNGQPSPTATVHKKRKKQANPALMNFLKRPEVIGGLAGAGLGGLSAATDPDQRSSVLHRALLGGVAGAGLGRGYHMLNSGTNTVAKSIAPTQPSPAENVLQQVEQAANVPPQLSTPVGDIDPRSITGGVAAGVGNELRHSLRRAQGVASNSAISDFVQQNPSHPAAAKVLGSGSGTGMPEDIAAMRTRAQGPAFSFRGVVNRLLNRGRPQEMAVLKNLARQATPNPSFKARLGRGAATGLATGVGLELLIDSLNNASRDAHARSLLHTLQQGQP